MGFDTGVGEDEGNIGNETVGGFLIVPIDADEEFEGLEGLGEDGGDTVSEIFLTIEKWHQN